LKDPLGVGFLISG